MNVIISWEGTDITEYVLEYTRENNICSGIGTLNLIISGTCEYAFNTWDVIRVKEGGQWVARYNIAHLEPKAPEGTKIIVCQDNSKRLTDYFIDVQLIVEYPSYSRYWLETVLNLTDVTYSINETDNGQLVSEGSNFGMQQAYDSVLSLLQMSGWYMYFDEGGIMQIGKLEYGSDVDETFDNTEILKTKRIDNDKMMRNKVIVWGKSDEDTGGWIYAEVHSASPWGRDDMDYRTIVYSNPAISSYSTAYSIATKILDEFSSTIPEKELTVYGFYPNVTLGSRVASSSDYNRFTGTISAFNIHVGEDGATTTYYIDRKCPRLFGYSEAVEEWVYIGTEADGVWRKTLTGTTWYPYSDGITDLHISDLSAYDGLLACVSYGGILYTRHTTLPAWQPFIPSFVDEVSLEIVSSGVIATACSIDKTYGVGGCITALFVLPASGYVVPSGLVTLASGIFPPSGNKSWIAGISSENTLLWSQQISILSSGTLELNYDVAALDLETNNDGLNLVSIQENKILIAPASGNFDLGYVRVDGPYSTPTITYVQVGTDRSLTAIPNIPYDDTTTVTSRFGGSTTFLSSPGTFGSAYTALYTTFPYADRNAVFEYEFTLDEFGDPIEIQYDITGTLFEKCVILNWLNDSEYRASISEGISSDRNWIRRYTVNKLTGNMSDDGVLYEPPIGIQTGLQLKGHYSYLNDNLILGIYNEDYYYAGGDIFYSGEATIITANMETTLDQQRWFLGRAGPDGVPGVTTYFDVEILGKAETPTCVVGAFGGAPHWGGLFSNGVDDWAIMDVCLYSVEKHSGNIHMLLMDGIKHNPNDPDPLPPLHAGFLFGEDGTDGCYGWESRHTGWNTTTDFTQRRNFDGWAGINSGELIIIYDNLEIGVGKAKLCVPLYYHTVTDTGYNYYCCLYTIDFVYPHLEVLNINTYYYVKHGASLVLNTMPNWAWGVGTSPRSVVYPWDYTGFSRNISKPRIFSYRRKDHITTDMINVLADPDNLENYITIERGQILDGRTFLPNANSYISLCTATLDDFDNTMYVNTGENTGWGINQYGQVTKYIFRQTEGVYMNKRNTWPTSSNFIEFTDGNRTRYLVATHSAPLVSSGEFSVIFEATTPIYLDTAKGTPTTVFDTTISGIGFSSSSTFLGTSFLNEIDSFSFITPISDILSLRAFDIIDSTNFPIESGALPTSFLNRYLGIATRTAGLILYDSELTASGHMTISTFSGGLTKCVDFTNFISNPYIFCAVISSGTNTFFQRNTLDPIFYNYSVSLPISAITIIRADDRI